MSKKGIKRKVYKYTCIGNSNMSPSDPTGSLDDYTFFNSIRETNLWKKQ